MPENKNVALKKVERYVGTSHVPNLQLSCYKKCFIDNSHQHQMITAIQKNFQSRMWYLTDEFVVFGSFDENLSNHE